MRRYWEKKFLNSNLCNFPKLWSAAGLFCKMRVNISGIKLNNDQSNLSSLSASLKKIFFVRKKALAEWSCPKLLTSILMNSYPEFSRDGSSVRHNSSRNNKYALSIYCVERSAVVWNRKVCWTWLPSVMPKLVVYRLQPSGKAVRGFKVISTRRSSPISQENFPLHFKYLPKCRLNIF